jgi:hypothetical protein
MTSTRLTTTRAALLAALAPLLPLALAACKDPNPAEVRTDPPTFPLRASWSATAAPVGTATVRGTLSLKEYLGSRVAATIALTAAPNTTYQWRIYRGDCTVTTAAVNNTAPTGLLLLSTIQSYPDIQVGASGSATVAPTIAAALDSLTSYSVRVRVAQTATNWNGTNPVACGNLQRAQGG